MIMHMQNNFPISCWSARHAIKIPWSPATTRSAHQINKNAVGHVVSDCHSIDHDSNRLHCNDQIDHIICVYRHCHNLTPRQARLYDDIWGSACNGICEKIQGYQQLVDGNNKGAAQDIYTSADACIRSFIHSSPHWICSSFHTFNVFILSLDV